LNNFNCEITGDELINLKKSELNGLYDEFFISSYYGDYSLIDSVSEFVKKDAVMNKFDTEFISMENPKKFIFSKTISVSVVFSIKLNASKMAIYSCGSGSNSIIYDDSQYHSSLEYYKIDYKR